MAKKKMNQEPLVAQIFHNVQLPGSIDGEGWTTDIEEGKRFDIRCVGDNAMWSIHLTRRVGERRFEIEAHAWDVDVAEVLPKIAQIVREQVDDDARPVSMKLVVTYC